MSARLGAAVLPFVFLQSFPSTFSIVFFFPFVLWSPDSLRAFMCSLIIHSFILLNFFVISFFDSKTGTRPRELAQTPVSLAAGKGLSIVAVLTCVPHSFS